MIKIKKPKSLGTSGIQSSFVWTIVNQDMNIMPKQKQDIDVIVMNLLYFLIHLYLVQFSDKL